MKSRQTAQFEPLLPADRIGPSEEPDEPMTAWSLEEFDEFCELQARRSAWDGADSRYA